MVEVDGGVRFLNRVIDQFCIFILLIGHAFLFDTLLHIIPPDGSPFLGIYYLVLLFGYYFLTEYYWGKTPGKFVTNTLVVDINGDRPTAKAIAIRTLCRAIPFDSLSFLFGNIGWHDSISDTKVVRIVDGSIPDEVI